MSISYARFQTSARVSIRENGDMEKLPAPFSKRHEFRQRRDIANLDWADKNTKTSADNGHTENWIHQQIKKSHFIKAFSNESEMSMIVALLAPYEFLRSTIKYYSCRSQDVFGLTSFQMRVPKRMSHMTLKSKLNLKKVPKFFIFQKKRVGVQAAREDRDGTCWLEQSD